MKKLITQIEANPFDKSIIGYVNKYTHEEGTDLYLWECYEWNDTDKNYILTVRTEISEEMWNRKASEGNKLWKGAAA